MQRPRSPCSALRGMTNDSYEVAGVKSADEHNRDSIDANVTNETSLVTVSEIQKRQIATDNYLLGSVIALGHFDALES